MGRVGIDQAGPAWLTPDRKRRYAEDGGTTLSSKYEPRFQMLDRANGIYIHSIASTAPDLFRHMTGSCTGGWPWATGHGRLPGDDMSAQGY